MKFMELEELFLKKEELPILYETSFYIPLHPSLLNEGIVIDGSIANRIFPQVAKEWYEELRNYPFSDKGKERWVKEVFLREKPKVFQEGPFQRFGVWEDKILLAKNGLVKNFSINRNVGGGIYFNKEDSNCVSFGNLYIKFTENKLKEFQFDKNKVYVYAQENVDSFPGALFLRNWAIMYMNEAFKEIFK